MILRTILDTFQDRIDDPAYWDDTKGTALANEAIRTIAKELNITFPGYYEFLTEDGRKQYDVPFDYIASHLLYYDDNSENQKITILNSPNKLVGVVSDIDEEGTPTHAYLWNVESRLSIFFYPVPDDEYTMKWWYFREAPALVNNNDEPILDRVFHQFIVDYMILASRRDDKEISQSEFTGLWEIQVRKLRASNTKVENLNRENKIPMASAKFPESTHPSGIIIRNQNSGGVIW